MGSNQFGTLFRIVTWGESHGKAIGVVIDGCPAGLALSEEEINEQLFYRRPGRNPYTSPRNEEDKAEIYSGVFEGVTTGTPISLIIQNKQADSKPYDHLKDILRPGHANYTYLEKYGIFDHRGGGRASARETACRVAAGAVAKKLLRSLGVEICAYLSEMGGIKANPSEINRAQILQSPLFCPRAESEKEMIALLEKTKAEGDSLGGIVDLLITGVPAGWGDPVYEKLSSNLGRAFLTIPACRGVEIGAGFEASSMLGSVHSDRFREGGKGTETNYAGGMLGGISTGMPIMMSCAFKPTSSNKKTLPLAENAKHDPCIAIRAVPVVEAMAALVLVDAYLMNTKSRWEK